MAESRERSKSERLGRNIETSFYRFNHRTFAGYVVDPDEPGRTFTIDLLIDGCVFKTALANEYVHDLAARGIGDGNYGFSLSLDQDAVNNAHVIEAALSNLGDKIAQPIVLDEPHREGAGIDGPGLVRWLGGLRFSGWIVASSQTAPAVDVCVNGELVTQVKALGWAHVAHEGDVGRAVRSFDFHLPERFADGCVHRLSITDEAGTTLGNAALPFVAFADGLADAISNLGQLESERLRGELFDLLLPMSLPLSAYDGWRQRFPIAPPLQTGRKGAVILVGPGNVNKSLASLNEQTHDDWVAASLVVAGLQTGLDPNEAQAFLEEDGQNVEFVVFALAETVFETNALARIANAFDDFKDGQIVYGDIDTTAPDGSRWPLAFPAFDYERMLEQGYCAHLFAVRRATAERAFASGASSLYRLFNCLIDAGAPEPNQIIHLPGALASIPAVEISGASEALRNATSEHLGKRGVTTKITISRGAVFPAVHVVRSTAPGKTTLIIPIRNRLALLRRCLDTIEAAVEKASADVLIVDNDSNDAETLEYLASIDGENIKVLRAEGPFNFARLNNLAAATLTSEYLCLLNSDVEALDDGWLDDMLSRISDPDVGAVGALLLWPSGIVQHGGVVLGPSFAAHHAFNDRVDADPGFGDLLRVAHQCSAVTAACLLTRRSDYLEVGGMDEVNFSVAFNDVDYCLKLRAMGKRIIFSPHARLLHLESASRGSDNRPGRKARFERELRTLRAKWSDTLLDDPYYNPVLSLDPVPYSALAWPPRSFAPRTLQLPVANHIPPGF